MGAVMGAGKVVSGLALCAAVGELIERAALAPFVLTHSSHVYSFWHHGREVNRGVFTEISPILIMVCGQKMVSQCKRAAELKPERRPVLIADVAELA